MVEQTFDLRSALAGIHSGHHGASGQTGATLTALSGLALAALVARGGEAAALSMAIERDFGVRLPLSPSRTAHGSVSFVWSGPDRWLAIGLPADNILGRLVKSAGALGSVTDLGGSRTIIRVSGPRARNGMMKLVPIDLDESAFSTGSAALTVAAHVPVQLWQVDAAPTYEIACPRSYGVSLWQALTTAFAEFGCDVGV